MGTTETPIENSTPWISVVVRAKFVSISAKLSECYGNIRVHCVPALSKQGRIQERRHNLSTRRISRGLVSVIVVLLVSHLAGEAAAAAWGEPRRPRHFFSLNSEAAPGAWFHLFSYFFAQYYSP